MKLYIVQKKSKKGDFYKMVVLRSSNDLSGEEIYFSGFLEEFSEAKKWGTDGLLLGFADISRDRIPKKV